MVKKGKNSNNKQCRATNMIFYAKERKERKEAQVVVVSLNDLYSIVLEYAVCDDPHSIHTTEQ